MSSFKKRQKTLKRAHKERSQLQSRQHLGLLEKHKDYVLRARDYEKKRLQLKRLHEKARNRNPDEFYYKMIKTQLKGGKHIVDQEEEKHGEEEVLLMNTQDQKYVQMKLTSETRKVERLRSCLHHTRHQSNTHAIFVDSPEEVTQKAAALQHKRKGTKSIVGVASMKDEDQDAPSLYKELSSRSHRCKDLERVCSKLKTKQDLMDKRQCVKLKGDGKPVYKWKTERLK